MISKLKAWLALPKFSDDAEVMHRANLLNATIYVCLIFIVAMTLVFLLDGRTQYGVLPVLLVTFIVLLGLRSLLWRGKLALVGNGLLVLIFTGTALTNMILGTVRAPVTSIYLAIVIGAGVMFGWRGTMLSTIISSLMILGLVAAENAGLLPPPDYRVSLVQWLTYSFLIGLTGYLSLSLVEYARTALSRSLKESAERTQAEHILNELQSWLKLLGENLEDAGLYVYSHDVDGHPHFEYLSTGMQKLNGVTMEDALRDAVCIHKLILPEYMPELARLEEHSKQTLTSFEMEFRQRNVLSNEPRWMLLRSTPRRRPDGSTVWYGVQIDISDRKHSEKLLEDANAQLLRRMQEIERLQDELRELSLRDPLTGLYNRRYLTEMMAREVARTDREQSSLSIVITDIDHFKKLNDTYGHTAGDEFLIAISRLMRKNARSSDIICRYGGEEFLLVMPGTTEEAAMKRAEELRRKCAEFIFQYYGAALQVTMSFGVATYPVHGCIAEEVIIKADKALYLSKDAGRNRVSVWQEVVN